MFVDEITLHIRAGNGGNGVARWLHEKGKEYSGPAGGNGGRGGDVYIRAVRDLGLLLKYRNIKEFTAENGQDGMNKSMTGKEGEDLFILLPLGSIVKNLESGKVYVLENEGEEVLILEGGRGGLGNEHFKASTNVRPKEFTLGKTGGEADFFVELQLVVDAGFIGLPNAGKSSLLNALTNAKAKVGNFQFTTLEPNLGDFYGYVLADIPGLIEGAAEGKGLGHKFLRHIKRTKFLIHCVSVENEDVLAVYDTVRGEIEKYGNGIDQKKEIVILTKTDMSDEDDVAKKLKALKKRNSEVYSASIIDDESVKQLGATLSQFLA